MKKRIIGIDVARALAVIGMIIVNFKIALGGNGANWVKSIVGFFEGKAAATFVVLAGVGLAFMTNTAIRNKDVEKLKEAQTRIVKRALILFLTGVSYIIIWPADILHFYGIYMLIVLLLLRSSKWAIFITAVLLILVYPVLMLLLEYDSGWDFQTFEYESFWTVPGFFYNLFYNGFHPVIPWTSFMLIGYWYGKQNLNSEKFVKKSFLISSALFIVIQIMSYLSISILSEGDVETVKELSEILGTSPMPPLPLYMFNGIAISIAVISACILVAKRFATSKTIDALQKTGQLALTFYVAHVIIGMGLIELINPAKMGNYSIEFSALYALTFSLLCIVFAVIWRNHKTSGPLEWVLRNLTDKKGRQ